MVFSEKARVALIIVAGVQSRNPRGWISRHNALSPELFRPSNIPWWATGVGLKANAEAKMPPLVEPPGLIMRVMANWSGSFGSQPSGGVMDPVILSCAPNCETVKRNEYVTVTNTILSPLLVVPVAKISSGPT